MSYLGYTQDELKNNLEQGYCYVMRWKSIDKLTKTKKDTIKAVKIYDYISDNGVGILEYGSHCFCDINDLNYWLEALSKYGTFKKVCEL